MGPVCPGSASPAPELKTKPRGFKDRMMYLWVQRTPDRSNTRVEKQQSDNLSISEYPICLKLKGRQPATEWTLLQTFCFDRKHVPWPQELPKAWKKRNLPRCKVRRFRDTHTRHLALLPPTTPTGGLSDGPEKFWWISVISGFSRLVRCDPCALCPFLCPTAGWALPERK